MNLGLLTQASPPLLTEQPPGLLSPLSSPVSHQLLSPQLFPSAALRGPSFQHHTPCASMLFPIFYTAAWNPGSWKVTWKCSGAFWTSLGSQRVKTEESQCETFCFDSFWRSKQCSRDSEHLQLSICRYKLLYKIAFDQTLLLVQDNYFE